MVGNLWWCNGSASLTNKPTRVSSSLIGYPIHSALCHIEAKSFVNYYRDNGQCVYQWPRRPGFIPRVESYRRLKIWYSMTPCLTLSIIRVRIRGEWSNPRKGVAPLSIPRWISYWKVSDWVALEFGRPTYYLSVRVNQ